MSAAPPDGIARDTVSFGRIIRSPELQIRTRIDPATVERYRRAMDAGTVFPPLTVAMVEGVPYLVDGFHRYEAACRSERDDAVGVTVIECTWDEARQRCALANLAHGLPLKSGELRQVFRMFVKSRGNRTAKGGYLSYRELAERLPGTVHTTLRNWMRQDFPSVYRAMGDRTEGRRGPGMPDGESQQQILSRELKEHLHESEARLRALKDPEAVFEARERLRQLLAIAEGKPAREPDF